MRIPLSWVRDFTPVDAPVAELVAALNQLGLEVDAVEEPGREIVGVVAARILDVLPHPDADKLRLADVDFGSGQTRVVCGAPNITPGMVVPFAPAGATLPGGFRLERRKIRGVTSDGMLCSARELGLGDDHTGILALDGTAELGIDVRAALGLDDVIFDLSITPNRPDAMCVVGVARELAAHFGTPLTIPEPAPAVDATFTAGVSVAIEAPDRCPRYVAGVAQVRMGASPEWMQQRLVKAGMRAISNVVDVTNYVLLERNQPLHAFDLGRLAGRGIVVRLAEDGEQMTTLDGVERELERSDLLICDAQRHPQALAGIMGGSTSEVTDATTEILLESAYFERMGIARTSKRLKLRSESSARFERGIDPEGIALNAARALELLVDVAEARVARDTVDEYPRPHVRPRITLRTSKVNGVLGTDLSDRQVLDALAPLGVEVGGGGDAIVAVPPSFRPDLEREIDLVEEVARRVGFASIGRTVPRPSEQVGGLTARQRARRLAQDALVGAGCSEAMVIPLVTPELHERFGLDETVEAVNPLRAEESQLRRALVPGLVDAAAFNTSFGQPDVALFELGTVFRRPSGDGVLPAESEHVAVVLVGSVVRRPVEPDRPIDVYDAVDVVRALADALDIEGLRLEATTMPGYHAGRSARVFAGDVELGVVGEVAPAVLTTIRLAGPVVAFEVDLDALLAAPRKHRQFVRPSTFPPSNIDLAFAVADDVPAAALAATLRATIGELLEELRVFDEFRSEALGPGRRSLAFALKLRAADRTLTDEEVGRLRAAGIAAVEQGYDATLRA